MKGNKGTIDVRPTLLYAVALVAVGGLTTAQASTYKLMLGVSRQDTLVAKPTIEVMPGRNAEMIVSSQDGKPEGAIRLEVSVSPTGATGVVAVHMKVFDKAKDDWRLRAQPDVTARLKENVSLNIGSAESAETMQRIGIRMNVAEVAPDSTPR